MTIRPGPDPTQDPRYHELASGQFERLCARLAARHFPDVDFGGQFEPNAGRKPQFGVDFRFATKSGQLLVGSCRADADPAKSRIVGAATEFSKHWDEKWKHKSVERFVLCLAATKLTDLRWDHIDEAKQEIQRLGIACEVWVPTKLTELLRDQRDLVQAYLPMYEDLICASEIAASVAQTPRDRRASRFAQMVADLESEVDAYADSLDQSVRLSLDKLEERDRRGELQPLLEIAEQYISDQRSWNALSHGTQARLLLAKAVGCLRKREFSEAESLRKRAALLDAPKDRYFEAVIKYRAEGANDALAVLSEPTSLREHTLVAALHVSLGKHDDAARALDRAPTADGSAFEISEVDRAHAFRAFSMGDYRDAIAHCEAALAKDPTNRLAKLTLGASSFAASLAPAAKLPSLSWPEPVPSVLVRHNVDAVKLRSRAYEAFSDLERSTDDLDDQQEMALWRFACLLDLPGRLAEAKTLLNQALSDQYVHVGFLVWALARQIEFDRAAAEEKVAARLSARPGEIETRVTAIWLLAEREGASAAKARLLDEKQWFTDQGAERIYNYWAFQLSGDIPESSASDEDTNVGELQKLVSIRRAAADNDQRLPAATFADESMPVALRLEAAEALAHLGKWDVLWKGVDFLTSEIATGEALQIAACAAVNAASGTDAEAFIEAHATEIYGANWPTEINRYYAYALQKAGKPTKALEIADKIAASGLPNAKTFKADLLTQVGDLKGAAHYLREAISRDELVWDSPFELIRWTQTLMGDDPDLARKCIWRLRQTGFEGLEGDAFFLALSLLPNDCADFAQAFYKAAHTGAVRTSVHSLDELTEIIEEDHQRGRNIEDLLWDAKIPSHFALGKKLGIYRIAPFVDPEARALSLICSPSRPKVELDGFEEIILDLTALLTIHTLDLWDAVLHLPQRLRIANSTQIALLELEREASPSQPNIIEEARSFLSMIKAKTIRTLKNRPKDAVHLFSDERNKSKNSFPIQEFVNEWRRDEEAARKKFFTRIKLKNPAIWLDYASLKALNDQIALQVLAENFNISIPADAEQLLRSQVREADIGSKVAQSLAALRDRISEEIRNDRIALTGAIQQSEAEVENLVQLSMIEILKSAPGSQTAVWIDDRYLNAHSKVEEAPVITCRDVLASLELSELISPVEHIGALHQLRSGGALFLQPTVEETIRALEDADYVEGQIKETPELIELRRSFASLFVFERHLSISVGGRPHPGELKALIDAFRLAGSTISRIWELETTDEVRQAFVRWVVTAFRFESSSRVPIENKSELSDRRLRASWLFSILLSSYDPSVIATSEFEAILAPRLRWLLNNVAEREWDADNQLKADVLEMLASFLAELGSNEDGERLHVSRILARRFIDSLPEEIADELLEHEGLAQFLEAERLVTIATNRFSGKKFWNAAYTAALGGNSVSCSSLDDRMWELHQEGDDILLESQSDHYRIHSPVTAISALKMKGDRVRRFRALLEKKGLRRAAAGEVAKTLAGTKDPAQAVLRYQTRIEGTARYILNELHESATKNKSVPVGLFTPPKTGEIAYILGFDGEEDFESAAENLNSQVGLEEAVRLWMHLPVSVPSYLKSKLERLATDKRNAILNRLVDCAHSPASAINLTMLSKYYPAWLIDSSKLADEFKNSLFENMDAFYALLDWSKGHLARSSNEKPHFRDLFSWFWAGAVFSMFGGGCRDLNELATILGKSVPKGPADLTWSIRNDTRLDSNSWAQLALQAVLIEAFGYQDLISEVPELERRLTEAFRHNGAKNLPKIELLMCPPLCDESFEHWLPERPLWLLGALSVEDEFTRNAFANPEATASSVVAEYSDTTTDIKQFLATFALLAPHLCDSRWGEVSKLFKRLTKKADASDLYLMSTVLTSAPYAPAKACLDDFVRRLPEAAPDNEASRAAISILECAYTVAVRTGNLNSVEFFDWLDDLAGQLQNQFGSETVALLDVIASSIPSHNRPRLTEIRSRVAFISREAWSQIH